MFGILNRDRVVERHILLAAASRGDFDPALMACPEFLAEKQKVGLLLGCLASNKLLLLLQSSPIKCRDGRSILFFPRIHWHVCCLLGPLMKTAEVVTSKQRRGNSEPL